MALPFSTLSLREREKTSHEQEAIWPAASLPSGILNQAST
jgi:hypothetical protein